MKKEKLLVQKKKSQVKIEKEKFSQQKKNSQVERKILKSKENFSA